MVNILRMCVQRIQNIIMSRGINITIPFRWTGYELMSEPKMPDVMTLERLHFTDKSTIGEIHLDGTRFCYSLELSCRKASKDGKLAIPCGRYEICMTYSTKFDKDMPEIMDVPGRTGIRIHPANYPSELLGCVAPGLKYDTDSIYDSRKAFDLLLAEIKTRLKNGRLFIAIIGGGPNA